MPITALFLFVPNIILVMLGYNNITAWTYDSVKNIFLNQNINCVQLVYCGTIQLIKSTSQNLINQIGISIMVLSNKRE